MPTNCRWTISSVETNVGVIRVAWADGHMSTYHHIWLRDNCACNKCGAHASGSRFQALLDIPDNVSPSAVRAEASALTITWANDGHESWFEAKWLREYCYSSVERARRHRKKVLWDGSLSDLPTVNYQLARENAGERYKMFAHVFEYGFVLLKNVGTLPEETERLARTIGYIRDTHFGPVTDLKLRADLTYISNFPGHILPHSDETYRHIPTGINIFHCIQPSEDGGGVSMLVDGHTCAARLCAEDPNSFAMLTRLPIQHERLADSEMIRSHHPAFTLDWEGNVTEVRLNERTMSGLSLPEDLMEPAYRALRKAYRIAYDPANRVEHRLEAGEALLFDNLRVLHGRTSFAGKRLLRQSNVMRDEFYARLAFLEERRLDSRGIG